MATTNKNWLPTGKHWGLIISRDQQEDAGPFISQGKPNITWHTTEGTDFYAMKRVLIQKRACPHLLVAVGGISVLQMIPFNRAGRALEHVGNVETNRKNHNIQIELCGFAKDTPNWTDAKYKHLAALVALIENRVNVQRHAPLPFTTTPHRIPDSHWYGTAGHIGHQHVPDQPSGHWDPGALRINKLLGYVDDMERKYGGN
jgi:hypothetical protein